MWRLPLSGKPLHMLFFGLCRSCQCLCITWSLQYEPAKQDVSVDARSLTLKDALQVDLDAVIVFEQSQVRMAQTICIIELEFPKDCLSSLFIV